MGGASDSKPPIYSVTLELISLLEVMRKIAEICMEEASVIIYKSDFKSI